MELSLAKIGRSFAQWLRSVAIGAVALIVLLAMVGSAYQAFAQWRDARRFPQQGRSVALGAAFPGVSLNIDCTGQGGTTVVLESGFGVPGIGWSLVQPDIAKFARVCSYDRAGYGWSSPGPMPRTSLEIARELHALLAAAEEKPPYVLVGHSSGGFNMRVYNHEYPGEVAGMVLVDASDEDQISRMPPERQAATRRQRATTARYMKFAPLLTRIGWARFASDLSAKPPWMPEELLDEVLYLSLQEKAVKARDSEAQALFAVSAEQVREAGGLGDKPLIVLSEGKNDQAENLPPSATQKDAEEFFTTNQNDLQARQARLSTRGRQIIVRDSGHMIPFERPDAVVSAVREVCGEIASPAGDPSSSAH